MSTSGLVGISGLLGGIKSSVVSIESGLFALKVIFKSLGLVVIFVFVESFLSFIDVLLGIIDFLLSFSDSFFKD